MKLCAIDTSTLVASVAIVNDNTVLAHRDSDVDTHSDNLLALIDEACKAAGVTIAELDAVAVGLGPGSFTGLRIGMATAKGLAYAANKPLHGVSSLAALAVDVAEAGADSSALIVPVLDARRGEVFAGVYRRDDGHLSAVASECVLAPEALAGHVREAAPEGTEIVVGGDAVELYAEALAGVGRVVGGPRTPSATRVAEVCLQAESRVDILVTGAPVYIRPSEAEIKFPKGNPGGTFARRDE